MLGVLSWLAALEAILVMLLVSRVEALTQVAAFCLGPAFNTRRGRAAYKAVLSLLSALLSRSLWRLRRTGHSDEHKLFTLEAYLVACSLFLSVILRQIYAIIAEDEPLKRSAKATKSKLELFNVENQQLKRTNNDLDSTVADLRVQMEKMKLNSAAKDEEIIELRMKLANLKLDADNKDRELRAAEANVKALSKQAEGLLLEYDRLFEDNSHLRSQISAFDRRFSSSAIKKDS